MTRHARGVSRRTTFAGVVLAIVLRALVPATAGTAGTPRDEDAGCGPTTSGARRVSCALADTLSAPAVAAYADVLEDALRAVGVDVAPRTLARWADRLGRIAAHYCEKGDGR
jgi:hypothetical protein